MTTPDPSLLDEAVDPTLIAAMKSASAALTRAGVRHAVAGGLAVTGHGHPSATKRVEFLIGDEAFEFHPDGLVTVRPGIPFQVNDVPIDLLTIAAGEEFLQKSLDGSILEAPPLIYLKLKSPRLQAQADIVELIKASLDVRACRRYLEVNAPDLLARFEELVTRAQSE